LIFFCCCIYRPTKVFRTKKASSRLISVGIFSDPDAKDEGSVVSNSIMHEKSVESLPPLSSPSQHVSTTETKSQLNTTIDDFADNTSMCSQSLSSLSTSRITSFHKFDVDEKLLPSIITPEKASKYFGSQSKSQFYDGYRYLDKKRKIIGQKNSDLNKIVKDPNSDIVEKSKIILEKHFANSPQNSKWNCSHLAEHDDRSMGSLIADESIHYDNDCDLISVLTQHSQPTRTESDQEVDVPPFSPSSPRAIYLAGCLQQGLPPRSAMLLRSRPTTALWLDHQGMGDELCTLLSEGLNDMPMINSINLSDNNLTDKGLMPLINSISVNPNIRELYLSHNVIDDDSAQALARYLSAPNCTIEKLILQDANVEDSECKQFVLALNHNKTLTVIIQCLSIDRILCID
jgi:hypothetical protein